MIHLRTLFCAVALMSLAPAVSAQALNLEFLPPEIEPNDICFAPGPLQAGGEPATDGSQADLSDLDRIRYLRSDIRRYTEEDADGFFDFIDALIERRGALDESFTDIDVVLAKIDLWLTAGRLDGLEEAGLVAGLRARVDELSNNQQVALARFYADGIGVPRDPAFAQDLIREAAFGGNARALLEIVRLQQRGALIEGWDAPLDLTVTMAFGGILGELDSGVCTRAERIAMAYLTGDVVAQNPALALAWFRFAADLGRAQSAWRVVEFYLNADAAQKDNIALRRYLEQAVRLGITVSPADSARLVNSGAISSADLQTILGFNYSQDGRRTAKSLSDKLQLAVNIDDTEPQQDSTYLTYLREISQMPQAPGRVFYELATATLVRKGRWAAEAEAIALLEEGTLRGDGPATRRLARMLVRYRDDPSQIARAESLLMEAVARHGMAEALNDLDALYRCQLNTAPRLRQADIWAANYRASGHQAVAIAPTDLLSLAADRSPEAIAKIQSQALDGRSQMAASQAQRVQGNPMASETALRFWAARINPSRQALEAFAKTEFALASTPAQRAVAVELFRRVYLNNGVTTALDLATALTEYNARDPKIAQEIIDLLTMAGNRGEGGAIRLLSRLQAGTRSEAEVFRQFADGIEARGNFLALMFAIPHIDAAQVDDYIDRAVSLMACASKDADELGSAYAMRGDGQMSFHWRRIGLHFDGGTPLSRLGLSNRQVAWFDEGVAPSAADAAARALEDGEETALLRLIALTANANLDTYDAQAAAGYILRAINRRDPAQAAEVAALYRTAPADVQDRVAAHTDIGLVLQRAAEAGSVDAAFEYGLLLRARASIPADLEQSANWLQQAAERGHRDALYEYGYAIGFGIGRPINPVEALPWLDRAALAGHPGADETAHVLRVQNGL